MKTCILLHQHQADTRTGHPAIHTVTPTEESTEKLLLLLRRDTATGVSHPNPPLFSNRESRQCHRAARATVFKGIREQILQHGIHLLPVEPNKQRLRQRHETKRQGVRLRQRKESLVNLLQISIQLALRHAQLTAIRLRPLISHQAVDQLQHAIHLLQGQTHLLHALLPKRFLRQQLLHRCLYQRQRRTNLMRRL